MQTWDEYDMRAWLKDQEGIETEIERHCDEVDTFDKLNRWYSRPTNGEDDA